MRRSLIAGAGLLAIAAAAGWYLFAASGASGPGLLSPDDPEVVAQGQQIYAEYCASCHGEELGGQPNWRQRKADGRLPAPPHDPTGHTWHHPDAQLVALTEKGPAALVGGDYESDMPGFGDVLSREEILAVLSYIKSTWPAQIRAQHDRINEEAAS